MKRHFHHRKRARVRRVKWSFTATLALLLGLLLLPVSANGAERVASEPEMKAAFLYNFLKFAEFSSHSGATQAVVIAIAGETPALPALKQAVAGRQLNGRAIIVKSVTTPAEAASADLLFLSATTDKSAESWMQAAPGALSVGETAAFERRGGMITFVREGDRVRFDINLASAERAGIKLSAQLLKLARQVRRSE